MHQLSGCSDLVIISLAFTAPILPLANDSKYKSRYEQGSKAGKQVYEVSEKKALKYEFLILYYNQEDNPNTTAF